MSEPAGTPRGATTEQEAVLEELKRVFPDGFVFCGFAVMASGETKGTLRRSVYTEDTKGAVFLTMQLNAAVAPLMTGDHEPAELITDETD